MVVSFAQLQRRVTAIYKARYLWGQSSDHIWGVARDEVVLTVSPRDPVAERVKLVAAQAAFDTTPTATNTKLLAEAKTAVQEAVVNKISIDHLETIRPEVIGGLIIV